MSARTLAVPRRALYLLPAVVFAVIAAYLFWGLDPARDPSRVPSARIDEPVPAFELPPIEGVDRPGLSTGDLGGGRVSLVNFFASWCVPCRAEHPLLMKLAEEGTVQIMGINYRDKPGDARRWLARLGNPYERIGADENGRVAIDWGVSGVPESFIVAPDGRIRYQHVGPMSESDIEEIIVPLVEDLSR